MIYLNRRLTGGRYFMSMKTFFGVRAILILLVLISMAPIFAVVIWASAAEQGDAESDARKDLRAQVRLRAKAQEQMLHGTHQMLNAIAHAVAPGAEYNERCNEYQRRLQEHFPNYAHLAFADLQGQIVCRAAADRRPVNIADRSYFIGAARSGGFSIGEYMHSRLVQRPAIGLSLPVFDEDGAPRGQQYAILDLAVLQQQLESGQAPPAVTELVADGAGLVLASVGQAAVAAGRPLPDFLLAATARAEAGEGEVRDATGASWLYAIESVRPAGEGRLVVIAMMPKASVLAAAVQRLYLELAVLALIAGTALLLAWRMGDRMIARPVERLLALVGALERNEALPRAAGPQPRVRELARIERGVGDLAAALEARSAQRDAAIAEIEQQKLSLARSELRYRSHFEASPQPMWVFDRDTLAFLEVNEAAIRHYGYSREEFMAMTVADIRPAQEVPALMESLRRTGALAADGMAARHRLKNGDIVHVEISGQNLDWGGRRGRAVAVVDVTSRVEAAAAWERLHETLERQVAERTKELAAANEELEAFSYSVSHDLRAPLKIVDGFCAVLVERHGAALPPQAVHYLERIRAGTGQMDTLILDLLAFARTGREPLAHQAVDLARLGWQVVASLRQRWPQRQVAVDIEEPLPAVGDPAMLKVVLENLLGNAWKFTAGVPAASISLRRDAAGSYVVTDNGAGFDPAYAGKLFRPFQRLHSTAEFEGSGVGLTIVQRIVQRHGGKVWGESERGRGARFFFTLPAPPSAVTAELTVAAMS